MKISVDRGAVGQPNGMHWGQAADGSPVLAIVAPGVAVLVELTASEAKDHGAAACFMSLSSALAAPKSEEAPVRASSLLVNAAGLPLEVRT